MSSRSASKKARTFEGLVLQMDYFDFKDDSRLNRRWRRKLNVSAAKQNSKRKLSCNVPEKRVKNETQVEKIISVDGFKNKMQVEETIFVHDVCDDENDSDYETYLMEVVQSCTDSRSVDEVGDDDDDGCDSSYEECLRNLCGDGKFQTDAISVGDVHDDEDPDYKVFLEHVKKDGNSYVLPVFVGSEMLDPIKYENDYGPRDMLNLETEKTLKSCSVNEKTKVKRTLRVFSNRENMTIENSIEDRESPRTFKEALETSNGVVSKRRKGSAVKRNGDMKCSVPVSARMVRFSNIGSGSEATRSAKDDINDNVESDGDRSYLKYLNEHTMNGKEIVYVGQSDNPLRIDEDEKSDSELEVIAMDKDPYYNEGYTPFVSARTFHECVCILLQLWSHLFMFWIHICKHKHAYDIFFFVCIFIYLNNNIVQF